MIALLVSILWMADSSLADEFVVNTTLDTVDANPGDGICADASGACSLRAAVMESNANGPSQDFIFLPPGTYLLTLPFSLGDDGGDLVITTQSPLSAPETASPSSTATTAQACFAPPRIRARPCTSS